MMTNDYVIFVDSACDIRPEILKKWGVSFKALIATLEDKTVYSDENADYREFYSKLKSGIASKTSAVSYGEFLHGFKELLDEGKDILYLGFSSSLSSTYNNACSAAAELRAEYPQRTIITVDTLCASAGYGMLIYLTVAEKSKGASIEQAAAFAEGVKLKICHIFSVADLYHLKKGGRVSGGAAVVGKMLGYRPLLYMNGEGKLTFKETVRGRKNVLAKLCAAYGELGDAAKDGIIFIAHSDDKEQAEELSDMFFKTYGIKIRLITELGTVIGSHTGVGTLSVFFVGKER